MSFKDHEVEVGMEVGVAVGGSAELFRAGTPDKDTPSLKAVAAGLTVNGVALHTGAPTGYAADFSIGDAKGFVAQSQTSAPQHVVAPKLDRSFS